MMSLVYYIFASILASIMLFFLYIVEPIITRQKIKNNNEHGSARWATKQEIEKNFRKERVNHIVKSGFPVYYSKDNKYVWFDMDTPHYIYLGSTGSGKSATAVIPECTFIATSIEKKSVFITDPKGEIFSTTSKMFKDNGYNVFTLDFRNPEFSNHFNLLETAIIEYELYDKNEKLSREEKEEKKKINYKNESIKHYSQCNQIVGDICTMIMADKTAKEAFWNNSASDLLYGIIFLFLEDYADGKIKREQITLTSMKKFQNSSMTDKNLQILKKYVESKAYGVKSKDKLIPIISTSENTYKSITSIFNERMSLFDDINVENVTSNSDFDFDVLGKEVTALFIIVPDESKIYYSLVSIVVSLIYRRLVLLCNSQFNKRLPYDLVFLLDEFANCPPISDIETVVSVARARGMEFRFFIQSFSQLDNLYGKEVSQIIQDNCGLAYLKTNTQNTAEIISKRLGKQTIESSSISQSLVLNNSGGNQSISLIARDLLTPEEVKQLHHKTIIFPTVGYPIFRNTVIYQKFSCYTKGFIDRPVRTLERRINQYYTVEQLKTDSSHHGSQELTSSNGIESQMKTRLEFIVNDIIKQIGKIDFNVDYLKENNDLMAKLYLASSLSINDIKGLEELSSKLNFRYNAISDKEKINRKHRNSLIEIFLIESDEKDKEV